MAINHRKSVSALRGSPVEGIVEIRVSDGAIGGRGNAPATVAGRASAGGAVGESEGGGGTSLNAGSWSIGAAEGSTGEPSAAGGSADTDSATVSMVVGVLFGTGPAVAALWMDTGIGVLVGELGGADAVFGWDVEVAV